MIASQMVRRLLLDLLGAGLLGIATIWLWWAPEQTQIGYLLQAMGALVVALGLVFNGFRDLFSGNNTRPSDQLLAIAVLAACAYGDFVTATLVPLALDVGRLFEERTALGVNSAIDKIKALQVNRALLVDSTNGTENWVEISSLKVGQTVVVRAGELIPVDGVVVKGTSKINAAVMTGESKLQRVQVGAEIFAGTENVQGELFIEITQLGKESALGRIVELMEEAQKTKPLVLQRLEQWLGVYVPVVIALAGTVLYWTEDLDRAIAVLIVSFPSSLAIAGSATMVSAFSKAASLSLFVKNATVFQTLREVGTLVVDKTGTLTKGQQKIESIECMEGSTEPDVFKASMLCARHSNHPVSQAIVRSLSSNTEGEPEEVRNVLEVPGKGVQVEVDGTVFRLGRQSWLQECGVVSTQEPFEGFDGTWVAQDSEYLGRIVLADSIRESAQKMLQSIREMGIETQVMLTGDGTTEANRVAGELNIEHVVSNALPEEKWQLVKQLRSDGHVVCVVGDGINDALALQDADVGIAIGASINQAAMGGADVALISDDLKAITELFKLSDAVYRKILQNIWIGFVFAGVLFAMVSQGQVTALQAAIVHNVGALLVIANSSLLWRQTTSLSTQSESSS